MAPKKLRQAIGAVKDQARIGLAKISSLSDLEITIVKATRHQETPPNENHIREILSLTSCSRALVNSAIRIIANRLNKTKNWIVALKALMLVQHLLEEGGHAYVEEIFFETRKGTCFLNMSDFRDSSLRYYAWDFSAFIRTYAMYLDEYVEFKMQGRKRTAPSRHWEDEEDEEGENGSGIWMRTTPVREISNELVFFMAHHVKQLIQKFLACKPTGSAKHNEIVVAALYRIATESFRLYDGMNEIIAVLTERFMELEVPDMARVYEIFCGVSVLYDELDAFYEWCKNAAIGCSSEYPDVEKIPHKKLGMMEDIMSQKSAISRIRNRKAKKNQETKKLSTEECMLAIEASQSSEQQAKDNKNNKDEQSEIVEEQQDKPELALLDAAEQETDRTTSISQTNPLRENWQITLVRQLSNPSTYETRCCSIRDPFAASLGVAPPTYVQMAEMETKQKLLVREQLVWQQYAADGMRGQATLARIQRQHYPYGHGN